MAAQKSTAQVPDEQTQPAPIVESVVVPAVSAPVFRDKRYTSRTLILQSGATPKIVAGKIAADTDELLAYLSGHEDFELLQE